MNNLVFVKLFLIVAYLPKFHRSENYDCKSKDVQALLYLIDTVFTPSTNCSKTDYEANSTLIIFAVYTLTDFKNPSFYYGNTTQVKLNCSKETKFIIHGWSETSKKPWVKEMVKAYFETKKDYNVIVVDWTYYAEVTYSKAICYVHSIGKIIANFITLAQLPLGNVHVIGFSLGGQIAGHVGKNIQIIQGHKLNRITGLDAAGPLYCFEKLVDKDKRIHADDAEFVDAIHTGGGVYGCLYSYGKIDFRPNCGTQQPQCLIKTNNSNGTSIEKFLSNSYCNHNQAHVYFTESIYQKDKFMAHKCENCENFGTGNYNKTSMAYMGESCSREASGNYYLSTNEQ